MSKLLKNKKLAVFRDPSKTVVSGPKRRLSGKKALVLLNDPRFNCY